MVRPFDIDEKRFYVPMPSGAMCPECGGRNTTCVDEYLSYPTANKPFKLEFVCDDCWPDPYEESESFGVTAILNCSLELVK